MSILEVPGAQLYYESVGSGPPLVLIPGGNGTAHIYGPLAQQLADRYTVTTYDRRGFARSRLTGAQDYERRLQTDADDVLRVIELVAAGPATVFGPSSGALIGLQALIQDPGLIGRLVAYEPPLMKLLADGQQWLDLCDETYEVYQTIGIAPALALFNGKMFPAEDVAFFAVVRDVSRPGVREAVEYWFEHELREYPAVELPVDALEAAASRIAVGSGRASQGHPLHDVATILAERLGQTLTEFPGGHTGYATHADEFGSMLLGLFDSMVVAPTA